jgi:[CysO sulfur-carrier protein]-S-L-cysteine hydrolase
VIEIPGDIRDAMVAHAEEHVPNEACGLLAGLGTRVEHLYRMRNADESPFTYRLEPTEQLQVFNEIDDKGWELVGIFHSHTHTAAYPSETDQRQAFFPEAQYVLVSLADPGDPQVRAFTIRDGSVDEQEVRIV